MKLIAVSLAYPPLAYPRSVQVARLLRHSTATAVVFCADEPEARLDATIEPQAAGMLSACIRVRVQRTRADRLTDRITRKFFRNAWNRRNYSPDAYTGWQSAVHQSIDKYLTENDFKPDIIVSFAQPFTDHLIGLELKRRLGLPWLAHFSDPWADNPFGHFDAATLQTNLEMERTVAENADLLVFTSQETVDLFFRKYSASLKERARVLPQCFDPEQFPVVPLRDRITIRYLGNFYGNRTPAPLFAALKLLARSKPTLMSGVSFEFIGAGLTGDSRQMLAGLPKDLVAVKASVDYAESLRLMKEADGLLVIDAPADISVFLPSKLIDYVGAGRPVFGVTPDGAASRLIRELGGLVAAPNDPIAIASQLEAFVRHLSDRRTDGSAIWGDDRVRADYSAERVAKEFDTMLKSIAA